MANEELTRLHAMVDGRVQGVSYRAFVSQQANNLGISGWVRNRWSGAVEVVAEGKRNQLELLLQALRAGPPLAQVTEVSVEWLPASGEFSSFAVRSSA